MYNCTFWWSTMYVCTYIHIHMLQLCMWLYNNEYDPITECQLHARINTFLNITISYEYICIYVHICTYLPLSTKMVVISQSNPMLLSALHLKTSPLLASVIVIVETFPLVKSGDPLRNH